MIVNKSRCKISLTDLAVLLIAILFLIGIHTWFRSCEPMESGAYMTCHWAEQAVSAVALLAVCLAAVHLCVPAEAVKLGMDLSLFGIALLSAFLPKQVIRLCMMDSMRCNATMKPWVIVFALLLMAAAAGDFGFYLFRTRKTSKQ